MVLSVGLCHVWARLCCLSDTRREAAQDGRSLQTRGQQPAGDHSHTYTHTHTHTHMHAYIHIHTENKELSLLLAGLSEEKAGLAGRTVIS